MNRQRNPISGIRLIKTHLLSVICILATVVPVKVEAAQILRTSNQAEIRYEVVTVKAGPGSAYISRGRVYEGDLVHILARENLTDWVKIRSGKLEGYVPLKALRFVSDASVKKKENANTTRRTKDYFYNDRGQRVDLTGQRVGSGETRLKNPTEALNKSSHKLRPISLQAGLGLGKLKRSFRSNVAPQSLLSKVLAEPIVYCFEVELTYPVHKYLTIDMGLIDYRFGSADLQTRVLNNGEPFQISNSGQVIHLSTLGTMGHDNMLFSMGPTVKYERHAFQETVPLPVFLTTTSTLINLDVGLWINLDDIRLNFRGEYGIAVSADQGPLSGGPLSDGTHWSAKSRVSIPLGTSISVSIEGKISETTLNFIGTSTHVDSLTDPNQEFGYTASQEINRLSSVSVFVGTDL